MTTTPEAITGIQSKSQAFHAIYTSPDMMRQWLEAAPNTRSRLIRAHSCLETANAPGYRHRLETVPAGVRRVIQRFLCKVHDDAEPVRHYIRSHRTGGATWDMVWEELPDDLASHGFQYGDAVLLGVDGVESVDASVDDEEYPTVLSWLTASYEELFGERRPGDFGPHTGIR